ncbi:MAG TPA: hypothetical protein GXZ60_15840 [Intrasporangiaceae bacterium]|nr:hypothetical protein [Intrasporangiaceae bacterium]
MTPALRSIVLAAIVAASVILSGCSGAADPDPAGNSSPAAPTETPSSPVPATPNGTADDHVSAADLARDILADTSWDAPPTTAPITVTKWDKTYEVAVESLISTAERTVLTLKLRSPESGSLPGFYGIEDLVEWHDLHQLSVEDETSGTRFYPFRYRLVPDGKKSVAFGTTAHKMPWMPQGRWITAAGIVLPPLPEGVATVKVNIPTSLTTTTSLGTDPLGTIDNVPVIRE